ncbi:MAG: phytochelatin synthase family protein, partial [Bdellovibrionota bacterium]
GKSCSIASVTNVMNALRSRMNLTSDDELFTQDKLLAKAGGSGWKGDLGWFGHGVTLDHLGKYVEEALKTTGLSGYVVETVHTTDLLPATAAKLHQALLENEKSSDDFIIANFSQGIYTGDTGGGHISPVGAYDASKKRVLVMDVDREWYEPYWVSEETFLKGMATKDPETARTRGYVWIRKTAR